MTQYNKGRRFEYKIRDRFVKRGYYVMRSAGSKGTIDLIAMKHEIVFCVQCKSSGTITAETRRRNISFEVQTRRPVVVLTEGNYASWFEELTKRELEFHKCQRENVL